MMAPDSASIQLPLTLPSDDEASFEFFVAGSAFVSYLKQIASGESQDWVWLQGAEGRGKTHLLCAMSRAAGRPAGYLDAAVLKDAGPDCLAALDGLELVLLDDFDQLLSPLWEEAWFHQFNRWRASGTQLVVASARRLHGHEVQLPDLQSRLRMMVEVQIGSLSAADHADLLQRRAAARGFALDTPVINYLLSRESRSARELVLMLDRLGHESLSAQRKLTVPFVRQVLGHKPV
ncbi:MAG: DnaA/Hda family protein [Lysobacterales bacterium]